MPVLEHQTEVKTLLEGMGNPAVSPADRYDKFCRLFWSNLNYNRIHTPLSRKGWPESAAKALADDALLFAAGGQDEAFHVIYGRLAADKLLLGAERPVVSRLLRDHPYALFVFSTASREHWHFLNVQYDDDLEKRRLFRRITVGPEECRHERLRTATERLSLLDLGERQPSAIELQNTVDEAFKVEAVTDEFFKEYASVFEEVEGRIRGIRDQERKRLFTQRLFNRLMFIAFIQKKGWLKFGNDADYLNALWGDYQRQKDVSNFYSERLKPLFFSGLNTANEVNLIGINRGGFLKDLIGQVPYLNGGAPDPSAGLEQGFRKALVDEFLKEKAAFMTAHGNQKVALKKKIDKLRLTIKGWAHASSEIQGFDWAVEFAEVFADGGFDVVLANPPYVRMELFKDIKPVLRRNFASVHAERADLYCYFYARALELLRPKGMISFISSNKWFRAGYGAKLREHVANSCHVISITDFGELPVFQAATFPMIFVARKVSNGGRPNAAFADLRGPDTVLTQVRTLDAPYPDVLALIRDQGQVLPSDAIDGSSWRLALGSSAAKLRRMEAKGVPLGKYVNGQIYWGVKTGFNEAFVIDGAKRAQLIAQNKESAHVIKALAVGDDIRKWRIVPRDRWLIYTHHGINTKGLSAILDHLRPYRHQLEQRATRQQWYELQQPQERYVEAFEESKIVFPDIAKEPRFSLDRAKLYINNTTYFMPVGDLYLLGVLNSACMWDYAKQHLTVLGDADRGGRLRFFRQFVETLPIPNADAHERSTIAGLVRRCLDSKGVGCEKWEKEINERVAALYGL